jgi:CheY-like chemotaxis protein
MSTMETFIAAPLPVNEQERLKALLSYPVDYSLSEKQFNDITHLASTLCVMPMALIVLIDSNKNYFKSAIGFGSCTAKREDSFCQYTLLGKEIYEVEDTLLHPNFKNNPYVLNEPYLRFYAGIPLINSENHALGTLCVMDIKPNKLTDTQKESLVILRESIINHLELKKSKSEIHRAQQKADEASRAKQNFFSAISHEIRTPLNGIMGITHLLMDESLTAQQSEYINALALSTNNLMNLINDILDFKNNDDGLQNTTFDRNDKPDANSEFSGALSPEPRKKETSAYPDHTKDLKMNNSLTGLRVLLVEDNDVNILITHTMLKKWDVQVTVARNGLEAIEVVQQHPFNVVLMDLHMPVMDGFMATEKIRKLGFSKQDFPIIALSASIIDDDQTLARDTGMNDFLSKPFNPTVLYNKLKNYLPHA